MTPGLINHAESGPAAVRSGAAARGRDWPMARVPLVLCGAAILLCLACGFLADVPAARLAAQAPERTRHVAALVSAFGDSGYMLGLSGLLAIASYGLGRRGGRWAVPAVALLGERSAFVFGTVAASGLIAQAVKHLVGRARPRLLDAVGAFHFDLFSIKASLASFPSGHTASAFGLALALGLMERRLMPPLLLVAALVGAARVALGAHFVSDVVAGAALGSGVTLGLAALSASRHIAFAVVGGRLRLKGDGQVWPGLIACAHGARRSA